MVKNQLNPIFALLSLLQGGASPLKRSGTLLHSQESGFLCLEDCSGKDFHNGPTQGKGGS